MSSRSPKRPTNPQRAGQRVILTRWLLRPSKSTDKSVATRVAAQVIPRFRKQGQILQDNHEQCQSGAREAGNLGIWNFKDRQMGLPRPLQDHYAWKESRDVRQESGETQHGACGIDSRTVECRNARCQRTLEKSERFNFFHGWLAIFSEDGPFFLVFIFVLLSVNLFHSLSSGAIQFSAFVSGRADGLTWVRNLLFAAVPTDAEIAAWT